MFFKRKEKIDISSLREIFDSQKKTLIKKAYPAVLNMGLENFNNNLESLWKSFSEKNANLEIKIKGNIPLLLVAQQGNLQKKIKMIKGHTGLDFDKIKKDNQTQSNPFYNWQGGRNENEIIIPTERTNYINSPSYFYIILDVEDGEKMVAKSAKESLKKFKKENRFALNLDESISLLTYYPEILEDHYLITAGSFYNKEGENLPLLWLLDEDHNPELHYAWFDIAHGSYGAASYAI